MESPITTIQIRENVKRQLDMLKNKKESYEEIIVNLIRTSEERKRKQKELLIEGCKATAEESLKITKEFEAIEDISDWEW
ncbi:MAG: antitoxin VapB family protein [archaeon]|nr:antitoxin VapB family protein [archaeon]